MFLSYSYIALNSNHIASCAVFGLLQEEIVPTVDILGLIRSISI